MTEDERYESLAHWVGLIRRTKAVAYEQRLGSTNLFRNRDKKNEKQPDMKGKVEVQVGNQIVELDIAAWERTSERAGTFYSLSVKTTSVRPNEDMDNALGQEEEIL